MTTSHVSGTARISNHSLAMARRRAELSTTAWQPRNGPSAGSLVQSPDSGSLTQQAEQSGRPRDSRASIGAYNVPTPTPGPWAKPQSSRPIA